MMLSKFPMFIVFDLDGTLACTEHRSHFIDREIGDKDWRGFYAACDEDPPLRAACAIFRLLVGAGHHVEIWSGRSEEVLDKTVDWLARMSLQPDRLLMRSEGDHTADTKLKASWLEQSSRKPNLVFEDRASVVAMWRSHGIPCFQVAPGDF